MTDRYKSLLVSLDKDMREDDARHLINAIQMLKGVLHVKGNVNDLMIEDQTIALRERRKIQERVWDALKDRE